MRVPEGDEKDILVICDEEAGYAEKLADFLNRIEVFPYQAEAFVSAEAAVSYMQTLPRATLLIEKQLAERGAVEGTGVRQILYLTDVRGYPWVDRIPAIYKYQSAQTIGQEILERLAAAENGTEETSLGRTKHIGVVSPVGRAFKTSFCLTLGQLLSGRAKVLVVTLERFSAFETMFDRKPTTGLSDLLYAHGNGCAAGRMIDFTEDFHGLRILPPVEVPEDLDECSPETVRDLIHRLAREADCDLVLYDLDTDPRLLKVFLPQMAKLYIPSRTDSASEEKVRAFTEWIGRLDGRLVGRTEKIVIPGQQLLPGASVSAEQLLWSSTGTYVRSLLGGML